MDSGTRPPDHNWNLLPLIPKGFVCDSQTAESPIELTTSWLAVNLFHGCSFGCTYCFRYRWHPERDPTQTVTVEDALPVLLNHPSFVPHLTPVTANVSSTDPMHPRVRSSTLALARQLDARGYRNPFGIVTKGFLSAEDAEELQGLKFLRPIVLASYSAMPARIEPIPLSRRLATMRNAVSAGLPLIISYKPIVPGWNDDEEQMREVMRAARDHGASAIIMGGLRLDEAIARAITDAGDELPFDVPDVWGEKALPLEVRERILRVHSEVSPLIPLYDHTSCAVSLVMEMTNYNALRLRDPEACSASCPARQLARCDG